MFKILKHIVIYVTGGLSLEVHFRNKSYTPSLLSPTTENLHALNRDIRVTESHRASFAGRLPKYCHNALTYSP